MADLNRIWHFIMAATIPCIGFTVGLALSNASLTQAEPPDVMDSNDSAIQFTRQPGPMRLDSDALPNLIQLHASVLSGGQPEGQASFEELSRRGVRTVISVDGAIPDVQLAQRFGIRYVHLPHGYDGISTARSMELAKAVREFDSPIYIHCHHGKHRSPAAAAVACVTAGLLSHELALNVLELAGTNPKYQGLIRTVDQAAPLDPEVLDRLNVQYRSVAEVPPMTTAMLALERTHDQLLQHDSSEETNQRKKPEESESPGRDVQENALLLREHFTELIRSEKTSGRPEDFMRWLRRSEQAAEALVESLGHRSINMALIESERQLLHQITKNCNSCHSAYRDSPAK